MRYIAIVLWWAGMFLFGIGWILGLWLGVVERWQHVDWTDQRRIVNTWPLFGESVCAIILGLVLFAIARRMKDRRA